MRKERPKRVQEVFTPGRYPEYTYVDEHLREKSQQLRDALHDGSMLISISGPSKSGKTVFIEKLLGKQNLIQVTGAGVNSCAALWLKVFDIIGTPIQRTNSTGTSRATSIGAKGGIEGSALIVKGKGEIEVSQASVEQSNEGTEFATDYLQLLIEELAETDLVVFIDDFHYINRDVQAELAQQIKEAIRNGVKFICASVPYHSDDVIRGNPDLRGRIFSIDFDYWSQEFLSQIASKGFDVCSLTFDNSFIEKLVAESAGSPQLMQYLCLNTCLELEIRNLPNVGDHEFSQELFDKVCRRTVLSTDYSSIVEKMLEGPKTRGSDRKMHDSTLGWQGDVYRFFLKALSLDPPQLNFRYQPLVDRITSICKSDIPSGSSITSACDHSARIANATASDNIVEWDSENDVFDIRDPYLLFYLRWSEIADV